MSSRRNILRAIATVLILLVSGALYLPYMYIPMAGKPIQLKQVRIAQLVYADTGGPTGAGTDAVGTSACADNMAWSNTAQAPSFLQSNDTSYVSYSAANWDSTNPTDEIRASNFGFTTSGTIDGIQVEVLVWTPAGGGTWRDVILFTAPGTPVGDDKSDGTTLGTTDPSTTYKSFGGSADTWNAALTSTQVNDAGFGVSLCWTATANNSTINVDQVRITVTYTPPAPSAPTVTTNAETDVSSSRATLNGEITATGGENATSRGFAWGTNSALSGGDTSTTTESGSFGTGTFSQIVYTLKADTTYYFRAYATNSGGTGYGGIEPLTTSAADSAVSRSMRLFEGFLMKLISGTLRLIGI